MNTRLVLYSAMFAGVLGFGLAADRSGVSEANAAPRQCWSGYHPDRRGDCQSNNPVLDTSCPPGLITQVFPNYAGYICVPIPRGY